MYFKTQNPNKMHPLQLLAPSFGSLFIYKFLLYFFPLPFFSLIKLVYATEIPTDWKLLITSMV